MIYHSPEILWAGGPDWISDGKYLLWIEIPANTLAKVELIYFRKSLGNGNGKTFYLWDRQISCEQGNQKEFRYQFDVFIAELSDYFEWVNYNPSNHAFVLSDD